jgi:hypothetical protein
VSALRLPGSPGALAVPVIYCRMVMVGGDSDMVVHFGISACDASHPRRSSRLGLGSEGGASSERQGAPGLALCYFSLTPPLQPITRGAAPVGSSFILKHFPSKQKENTTRPWLAVPSAPPRFFLDPRDRAAPAPAPFLALVYFNKEYKTINPALAPSRSLSNTCCCCPPLTPPRASSRALPVRRLRPAPARPPTGRRLAHP